MPDIPRKYRILYKNAITKAGRKAKIRFHCLECVGFDNKEVTLCTSQDCVFYKTREEG